MKKLVKSNFAFLFAALFVCFSPAVYSESSTSKDAIQKFFPASYATSLFEEKIEKAVEVKNEEVKKQDEVVEIKSPEVLDFATSDVSKKKFLPPDQTPNVAVNPEAPSSVISMIESNRRGDTVTAKAYAKQFVRMLQNYLFEVRQITSLIGDALIEETVIKEDDWVGAEQSIDIELAKTRLEKGVPIKPTQDVAMKRIVADPKKEVEVYYFFSRACAYCRFMSPDVERIARYFKDDTRVKITGLVVGESDEAWLTEFRDYTGLSIPIYDGTDFSKHLKIGFLPVLYVVSPNGGKSYFKSGQQSFESMYEFIRTAQGLPVEDSVKLQSIIKTPIGATDKLVIAQSSKNSATIAEHYNNSNNKFNVNLPKNLKEEVQVDKF